MTAPVSDRAFTIASVSQVETASHDQPGGCMLKWWLSGPMGLKPEQNQAQSDGDKGHALLARYLLTGELPPKRAKMSKAVTGAILKGELPKPGDDLLIERRFSEQEKFSTTCECGHGVGEHVAAPARKAPDAPVCVRCPCPTYRPVWIPLDVSATLHLAGMPWEGFIDLAYRRGDVPTILDHKFFSRCNPEISPDPYHWLKKPEDMIKTVQLPVYVKSQQPFWPDAKHWNIGHHYVCKQGVDSFIRSAVVSLDQVDERIATISQTVGEMRALSLVTEPREVPFNRRSCDAYGGCPHQSICPRFKEKPTVQLTPEELAAFGDVPAADAPVGTVPAPAAEDPFDDVPDLDEPVVMEAPVAPAPAKRRMLIVDEAPAASSVPAPVPGPSTAPVTAPVVCGCGEKITSENGSKLRDGSWKHIGCKLDAPPPAPAPAPRQRAPKKAPPPAPVETPAAPAPSPAAPTMATNHPTETSRIALPPAEQKQSDRDATSALPSHAPAPVSISTAPIPAAFKSDAPPAPTNAAGPSLREAAAEFLKARFTGVQFDSRDASETVSLINAAVAILG